MKELKKLILCNKCKFRCLIEELTLYQTHWHVPPRGCTEGDYWKEGECQFICYHCNTVNRLLFATRWDSEILQTVSEKNEYFKWNYRQKFKEVVETHGKQEEPKSRCAWINNYWIDTLVV